MEACVLDELSKQYNVGAWGEASKLFVESGELIIQLCKAAMKRRKQAVAGLMTHVADMKEKAYTLLEQNPLRVRAQTINQLTPKGPGGWIPRTPIRLSKIKN
jgi:hypothetical protein